MHTFFIRLSFMFKSPINLRHDIVNVAFIREDCVYIKTDVTSNVLNVSCGRNAENKFFIFILYSRIKSAYKFVYVVLAKKVT